MRKEIKKLIEEDIEWLVQLKERVEGLAEEEREKFENLNEGMQAMEKFQKLSENADNLDEDSGSIDDVIDYLGAVLEDY